MLLEVFSCYAGLRLWVMTTKAVKIAKLFLITQLFLMLILIIMRPLMEFSFAMDGNGILDVTKAFIPYLLYFSVWYSYLSFSARVRQTYADPAVRASELPLPAPQVMDNLSSHSG